MKKMLLSGVLSLALCAAAPAVSLALEDNGSTGACSVALQAGNHANFPSFPKWLQLVDCSMAKESVYVVMTNPDFSPFGLVCISPMLTSDSHDEIAVNIFIDENFKQCTGETIEAVEAMIRAANPDANTKINVTYLALR